jgi:hypothetical protein
MRNLGVRAVSPHGPTIVIDQHHGWYRHDRDRNILHYTDGSLYQFTHGEIENKGSNQSTQGARRRPNCGSGRPTAVGASGLAHLSIDCRR